MPPFLVLDWNALTDVALAKVVAINIATEDEADKQEQLDQWQQRTAFDESIYNGTVIRWRYWVEQMPQLSAAEAARLMSALDPDLFKSLDHRPNKNDPTKRCEKAAMIQRLAERQDMQVATPTEWLAWAIQEQIKVHDGFRLAVESLTAPVVSAGDSYTLADAAQAIAAQQGWHDGARDTLKKQMMQAASDGTLTVRNPHTDLPYKPGTGRDFYELVTPADVNAWLEKQGAPYRWNVAAPAKDTAKPAPMVTARDAPAPLTEGDGRAPSTIPNGPRFSMTKAGLIEAHEHEWPTIKGDIAGAATNGLKAAKAGSRGWYEDIAMEWARAKGRRTTNIETTASLSGAMNRMATLPSSKHLEER